MKGSFLKAFTEASCSDGNRDIAMQWIKHQYEGRGQRIFTFRQYCSVQKPTSCTKSPLEFWMLLPIIAVGRQQGFRKYYHKSHCQGRVPKTEILILSTRSSRWGEKPDIFIDVPAFVPHLWMATWTLPYDFSIGAWHFWCAENYAWPLVGGFPLSKYNVRAGVLEIESA